MMRQRWTALGAVLLITLAPVAAAASADGNLGAPCASAADCVAELDCLPPEAGVAGGICTLPCVRDEDCPGAPLDARCSDLGFPTTEYCVERCNRSSRFDDGLDPDKCHGRPDMACVATGCLDGSCSEWCAPFCSADEQCPSNFYCNKATLLCEGEPAIGDSSGALCDPFNDTCEAKCAFNDAAISLTGVVSGFCQELCVIGSPLSCPAPTAQGLEQACLRYFAPQGAGQGDLAGCAGLCTCSSQCGDWFTCVPWDFGERGIKGVCTPGPPHTGASDCFDDPTAAKPVCSHGPERACNIDSCLGTAVCQADGTYGECRCLPNIEQGGNGGGYSDAAGEAGAKREADPGSDSGNGGRDPKETGCGCRAPIRRDGDASAWLLGVLCCAVLRARSERRRNRPI